jgi:FKBP-type peptidyl-prolyl cis-trans isomerase
VEKSKMTQVLVPAVAAAGVVVLIGVLIAMSDWDASAKGTGKGGKQAASGSATGDEAGMSDKLPPLEGEGWKSLPNGMRTWDVTEGAGEPCPAGATVTIHYTGWLTDGTVFDSSRGKEPAVFPLRRLIQGWQEGIPGMKPGGVRRLEIPYQLGYGERGSPPKIPPKATLVFEIKMIAWN